MYLENRGYGADLEFQQAEAIVRSNPDCHCGRPGCVVCMAKELVAIGTKNKFQNRLKGNHQVESTKNQQISENFVSGPDYLRQWNNDAALRQEFDGDFESYCHFQAAYSAGCVKIHGEVR